MKYFYLALLLVLSVYSTSAQIVNIPDANFKEKLLNYSPVIDLNGDGEIQYAEAENVTSLNVSGVQNSPISERIQDLTGIEAFVNLTSLTCNFNYLTTIDISQLNNLVTLYCFANQLTGIDTSNNPNLQTLFCVNNNISEFDFSQNPNLYFLNCQGNNLTELDVSQNLSLFRLDCGVNDLTSLSLENNVNLERLNCENNQISSLDLSNNPISFLHCHNNELISINVKNGVNFTTTDNGVRFENNPNLEFICVDSNYEMNITNNLQDSFGYNGSIVVNSYCSFVPGGEFFTVQGNVSIDLGGDGCNDDANDIPYPCIKLNVTSGINQDALYADHLGDYSLNVQLNSQTLAPVLENLPYFIVTPPSVSLNLNSANNPVIQDFCVTPDGIHNDLEIVILPLEDPRPGEVIYYKLIYKNKGGTTLSGSVTFNFYEDLMDYVAGTPIEDQQNSGEIIWDFTDLLPLQTEEIYFALEMNTPTDSFFPLNSDDVLLFDVEITPINEDETPNDNVSTLSQVVVNSYDPNDKRCLEGDVIRTDFIGEYVHYMIRFENTGTANANNVVIKDIINTSMFDVSSLIPLHASHNFTTRITNNNVVEFIFENINLPFDDANNDGYVVFKIKILNSLQEDDIVENTSEIYFDFNFPIITNTASTIISDVLSIDEFLANDFRIYPNPVSDFLTIQGDVAIENLKLYDLNGRLLNSINARNYNQELNVDVENLSNGIYFLKIQAENQEQVIRFIKN